MILVEARPTIEAMIPVLRAITEHTEDLEGRLSRVVKRVIQTLSDSVQALKLNANYCDGGKASFTIFP